MTCVSVSWTVTCVSVSWTVICELDCWTGICVSVSWTVICVSVCWTVICELDCWTGICVSVSWTVICVSVCWTVICVLNCWTVIFVVFQVEPDLVWHQRGQLGLQRGALLLRVCVRSGRLLLAAGRAGAGLLRAVPRGQRVQRRVLLHQHILGLVRQRVRVAGESDKAV